jgi:hypothetical protein
LQIADRERVSGKTVLIFAAVAAAIALLDRLLLWAERRGWIYYRKRRGRSGSASSAFLEVQSLLEPSTKHVIEARTEETEADDAGEP